MTNHNEYWSKIPEANPISYDDLTALHRQVVATPTHRLIGITPELFKMLIEEVVRGYNEMETLVRTQELKSLLTEEVNDLRKKLAHQMNDSMDAAPPVEHDKNVQELVVIALRNRYVMEYMKYVEHAENCPTASGLNRECGRLVTIRTAAENLKAAYFDAAEGVTHNPYLPGIPTNFWD